MQIKQRLVGALVLLAVAAILLSLVFGAGKQYKQPLVSVAKAPKPPQEAAIKLPKMQPMPTAVAPVKVAKRTIETTATKTKPVGIRAIGRAQQQAALALPQAWIVQLASFGFKSNALKLQRRLARQGFKAYVQAVASKQGKLYRVYVGPVTKERQAKRLVARLAHDVRLKGLVLKFNQRNL